MYHFVFHIVLHQRLIEYPQNTNYSSLIMLITCIILYSTLYYINV